MNEFVYEFLYNSDSCESAAATISIHKTQKGADIAMNKHKDKVKKQWELDCKNYPDAKQFPFDYNQWWGTIKTKLYE